MPQYRALLETVAAESGIPAASQFVPIPGVMTEASAGRVCHNYTSCFKAFEADNVTITDYILARPNATQNVIVFQSAYYPPELAQDLANVTAYTIMYNDTINRYPFFGDDHTMELKRALDAAIMQQQAVPGARVDLSVGWRKFPTPLPRVYGYDVVASDGAVWFYLPPMITFFVLLNELVTEKEDRLRVGMQQMGMRSPPCT